MRNSVTHSGSLLAVLAATLVTTLLVRPSVAQQSADAPSQAETKAMANEPADLIIHNAKIWTGDSALPEAESLAIRGDAIIAVGGAEQMEPYIGEKTHRLDAGGRRVIPGITDSHTHFLWSGLQLARIDLSVAPNKASFIDMIAGAASKLPPGRWLLGGRYTVESWPDAAEPRKEWIDDVTPGTPVYLTRTDGHQAYVNSVALKYARIDRDGPPDPPGGEIERDPETGEPTGILKDAAMELVTKHIPEPSLQENTEALRRACEVANAWGITSVHDMSTPGDLPAFRSLYEKGGLTVRLNCFVESKDYRDLWPKIKGQATPDGMFKICGVKGFMDGSLGSRTAYMREPYSDAAPDETNPRGFRAEWAVDLKKFADQLAYVHENGGQLAVHAIGDQAISELLDIFAKLPNVQKARPRVEHAQHVAPADFERFAELGVIASMQPYHKADDGRWAEVAIGPERAQQTYAWRSFLDSGAMVIFGSDVPVAPNNPFSGMAAAVTGRTLDGKIWVPEQNIPLETALRCYTVTPPYGVFREKELGRLMKGMLADVVILDRDILSIPIEQVDAAESWLTIVNGRVVYQKANR